MKIVVCAKFVPDATADRSFRSEDNTVDRAEMRGLLSELDENAVEAVLTIAENAGDSTVTVLTVGPEQAVDAVKKALQMGADAGQQVLDDAILGSYAFARPSGPANELETTVGDLLVFALVT